jgi:hypothetical protein
MKTAKLAITALGLVLASPAYADLDTFVVTFGADNFSSVFVGQTPPVDPVEGAFVLIIDPTKTYVGRVEVWRGDVRLSMSVFRPFRLAVP